MPYYVAVDKSELSIEDRFETNDTIKFDGRDTDRLVFFEVNNFRDAHMATAFRNDRGEIYIEFKPIENVSDSREEVVPKVVTIQMLTTRMEEFEDKLEHTQLDDELTNIKTQLDDELTNIKSQLDDELTNIKTQFDEERTLHATTRTQLRDTQTELEVTKLKLANVEARLKILEVNYSN